MFANCTKLDHCVDSSLVDSLVLLNRHGSADQIETALFPGATCYNAWADIIPDRDLRRKTRRAHYRFLAFLTQAEESLDEEPGKITATAERWYKELVGECSPLDVGLVKKAGSFLAFVIEAESLDKFSKIAAMARWYRELVGVDLAQVQEAHGHALTHFGLLATAEVAVPGPSLHAAAAVITDTLVEHVDAAKGLADAAPGVRGTCECGQACGCREAPGVRCVSRR